MQVYQVIENQYDSDDGHYEDFPLGYACVYRNEVDAIRVRDTHNLASITEHNARTVEWRALAIDRGWSVKKASVYFVTFDGDPTDDVAIVLFANRANALTYFTIETLEVV